MMAILGFARSQFLYVSTYRPRRLTLGSKALLAGILVFAHFATAAADPIKLRIAWVTTTDGPLLLLKKGIARHEGVSYTIEPIHFQGSPPIITALAAGDVDLAGMGFSTFPIAIQNAGLADVRIIADGFQDGVPGYYSNTFLVLRDGPVRSVEDMKGRVAATNATGSAIDITLRAIFRKHGLDDKRDVTILEAAFPNMSSMLQSHKVDLIAGIQPDVNNPAVLAWARPIFGQADGLGPSQMAFLSARQGFLEKNHAALVDYLEDELRSVRWFFDTAHHDEAVKIMADWSKVPVSQLTGWMFTKEKDFYHDPDGRPNLDALQKNIEVERQLGLIKSDVDVKRFADLSYIQEAASRLK